MRRLDVLLGHAARLQPVEHVAHALAIGRRIIIEIDEGAAAPQFHAHRAQRQFLLQLGVPVGQGFLFAPGLTPDEFARRLSLTEEHFSNA